MPYSVVSFYSAFINPNDISPLGSSLPAMFAKSSLVWSSLLILLANKQVRSKLNKEWDSIWIKDLSSVTFNVNL